MLMLRSSVCNGMLEAPLANAQLILLSFLLHMMPTYSFFVKLGYMMIINIILLWMALMPFTVFDTNHCMEE